MTTTALYRFKVDCLGHEVFLLLFRGYGWCKTGSMTATADFCENRISRMPSEDDLRKIAAMFEADASYQEIETYARQQGILPPSKDKQLNSQGKPSTRGASKLMRAAVRFLLTRDKDLEATERKIEQIIYNESLETSLETKYSCLYKVIVVSPQIRRFTARPLDRIVAAVSEFVYRARLMGEIHIDMHALLGGEELINGFNLMPTQNRANVYLYPCAIVPRTLRKDSTHIAPELCVYTAWARSGYYPGHFNYGSVSPPDVLPDMTHEEVCEQLCEEADDNAKHNNAIRLVLKQMTDINYAVSGFSVPIGPQLPPEYLRPIPSERRPVRGNRHNFLTPFDLLSSFGVNLESLAAEGVVGEFGYCLFDERGVSRDKWRFFLTPTYATGVEFYKKKVDAGYHILGTGGIAVLPALRAALRGKFISVLVTDEETASALLNSD